MEAACWIMHGIPFRSSPTVYGLHSYQNLPPIDCQRFSSFETAEDIELHMPRLGPNPLGAEWCFEGTGMFLRDRAYGLSWFVAPSGCVRVVDESKIDRQPVVSKSLPEFLARMKMENGIWWTLFQRGDEHFCEFTPANVAKLWCDLYSDLGEAQLNYLKPYYEAKRYSFL